MGDIRVLLYSKMPIHREVDHRLVKDRIEELLRQDERTRNGDVYLSSDGHITLVEYLRFYL